MTLKTSLIWSASLYTPAPKASHLNKTQKASAVCKDSAHIHTHTKSCVVSVSKQTTTRFWCDVSPILSTCYHNRTLLHLPQHTVMKLAITDERFCGSVFIGYSGGLNCAFLLRLSLAFHSFRLSLKWHCAYRKTVFISTLQNWASSQFEMLHKHFLCMFSHLEENMYFTDVQSVFQSICTLSHLLFSCVHSPCFLLTWFWGMMIWQELTPLVLAMVWLKMQMALITWPTLEVRSIA